MRKRFRTDGAGFLRGGVRAGAARNMFIALALCLMLTGCDKLSAAAVQSGLAQSPYYHLGDTTWDHGGIEEYYFNQIPSELNEIYRELYSRISNYEDDAELYAQVDLDSFWTAYDSLMADHPEFFWVGSNIQVQQSALTGNVVHYTLSLTVDQENRDRVRGQLENAADAVIAQIPSDESDYEKIKDVYEYLIDTTDYSPASSNNQNIQSALLEHASVCAGYSRAFQYILHRMGLFCTYVTGKTGDGQDHAWNIVRIGDQYYNVDVTWGDPVFVGHEEGTGASTINYNFLCCTDAELSGTHVADTVVAMPSCTDGSLNYYKLNGFYYETFDYDTIYSALMNDVWSGNAMTVMKFGNAGSYETARYELFENGMLQDPCQYLMDINGVTTWNYSFHTDDDFNLITIYWQ